MATEVVGADVGRPSPSCLGGPCGPTGGVQMVAGALLAGAGLMVALDDVNRAGWVREPLRFGPQLTGLFGPLSGDSGAWLQPGAAFEVGSSGGVYLHLEPTLAVGRVSRNLDEGVGTLSAPETVHVEESTTIVAVLTRLQAGVGFGPLTLRGGPAVGYATGWFDSTGCGASTYDQLLFGASTALGARFGAGKALEVGLVADAVFLQHPVCRSRQQGGDPLVAPSELQTESAWNTGLFVGATAGYAL